MIVQTCVPAIGQSSVLLYAAVTLAITMNDDSGHNGTIAGADMYPRASSSCRRVGVRTPDQVMPELKNVANVKASKCSRIANENLDQRSHWRRHNQAARPTSCWRDVDGIVITSTDTLEETASRRPDGQRAKSRWCWLAPCVRPPAIWRRRPDQSVPTP